VPAVVASELYCDDWAQASHGGELTAAAAQGLLTRERVTELGEVLTGIVPGRSGPEATTMFDSTGLAIQDLAICLALLEAHRAGAVAPRSVRL
jgi:alanine dehydrogenase